MYHIKTQLAACGLEENNFFCNHSYNFLPRAFLASVPFSAILTKIRVFLSVPKVVHSFLKNHQPNLLGLFLFLLNT